jgi:hypothetical protein
MNTANGFKNGSFPYWDYAIIYLKSPAC